MPLAASAQATQTIANLGPLPPTCNFDSGAEGSGHICQRTNQVFSITSSSYSWQNDDGDWTLDVDLNLDFPDTGSGDGFRHTVYWAAVSDDRQFHNPYQPSDDFNNLTFFGDLATYDDHVSGTTQAVYQHCRNGTVCHLQYKDVSFSATPGQPFWLPLTVQRLQETTDGSNPPYDPNIRPYYNGFPGWDIQRDNVLLSLVAHPGRYANPTAAFTYAGTGNANEFSFASTSTAAEGASLVSYDWNFGDGSPTGHGEAPVHTYTNAAASHVVTLTVTDSLGSTSMATRTVSSSLAPVVNSTGDDPLAADKDDCDTGNLVGDQPECTLRAAIQTVNLGHGDGITFAVPGAATPVIHPSSPLPPVMRSTVIDATSQTGGWVAVDGSGAGADSVGLRLSGGSSTVKGFVLNAFTTAIQADSGSGHTVVGNRIGTDLSGTAVGVPGRFGVTVGTPSTVIGGSGPQGNVVVATGTAIFAAGADDAVTGNDVSVGADGTTSPGNASANGILAISPGAAISDNTVRSASVGIGVLGANASGATITDNHVGTTRDGTAALAMQGYGIRIDGAPGAEVTGNVVATQGPADISISGSKQYTTNDQILTFVTPSADATGGTVTGGGAIVRGNTIGLLGDATTPGRGAVTGIWGWAGAEHLTIDGNTIAGQSNKAIELDGGSGHVMTGNHLGTDRAGTTSFPMQEAILLAGTSGATVGGVGSAGNVIGGGHDAGVLVTGNGSTRNSATSILGNWIGVGPDGTSLPNHKGITIRQADTTVVGPDNVVGDNDTGIEVGRGSIGTSITGNRIGTRGTAATGAPNVTGIVVGTNDAPDPDATTIGPDNVISLNGTGIVNAATSTTVDGNRIGTAASSDDSAPNVGPGLLARSGDLTATGNTIAFDTPGVEVDAAANVALHGNRIFGNQTSAIVHPGEPAAPDLLAAIRTTRGTTTRTLLLINGLPKTDAGTIEVFANDSCADPQARYVLQLTKAKLAGAAVALINMVGRADRSFLTVDYTDSSGNTSQLSNCEPAGAYPDTDGDGSPDVLEQLVGLPGSASDPSVGAVYTDRDQLLLLKSTAGRFTDLGAADDPSPLTHPDGMDLPYGLINFEIHDLPPDGKAAVALFAGFGTPILADGWAKYGAPTPGADPRWYDFTLDDASQTGAVVTSTGTADEFLTLLFQDGSRGDADGQLNGVIRDPGGPATFADTGTGGQPGGGTNPSSAASVTTTALSSSSNPSVTGQHVIYTATVIPAPDGGSIRFLQAGTTIAGCGAVKINPSTGIARCRTGYGMPGFLGLQAKYAGDPRFTSSQSPTLIQAVRSSVMLVAPPSGKGGVVVAILACARHSHGCHAQVVIRHGTDVLRREVVPMRGGATMSFAATLNAKGRSLLVQHKRLPVELVVRLRSYGQRSVVVRQRVVVVRSRR